MLTLHSSRLFQSLITIDHIADIHALHCFPEVGRYNTLGVPSSLEETANIITPLIEANLQKKTMQYTFAIELKQEARFIGCAGLWLGKKKYRSAEVWYKFRPDSWGKGYATEALTELLHFGFTTLKLHRIEAGCAVGNAASIRVLEKVGMLREGRKRLTLPLQSGWSDNFEYAMLENDFKL